MGDRLPPSDAVEAFSATRRRVVGDNARRRASYSLRLNLFSWATYSNKW